MYSVDTIPLKLESVGFYYQVLNFEKTVGGSLECAVNTGSQPKKDLAAEGSKGLTTRSALETRQPEMNWSCNFPQGCISALIGKHGDGKSTLLKLIGGVLLPTSGCLFIPPQLRVFPVGNFPIQLKGSLFDNLTFGLSDIEKASPAQIPRVKEICRRLGLSEQIVDYVSGDVVKSWGLLLSISQLKKIHLARAFVSNPEVLVLDRPTAGFDLKTTIDILDMMQEHVRLKGLGMDEKTALLRRPRTIIFSTDRPEACSIADLIYLVKRDNVREVGHHLVSDNMLYQEWKENDIASA